MSYFPKAFQPIPVLVDDSTATLATTSVRRLVNLKEKLPDWVRGMPAHVMGFLIEAELDPTFTNAPTLIESIDVAARITLRLENSRVVYDAGSADCRAFEFLENGAKLLTADPDGNSGSTNNIYSTRFIGIGIGGFEGNPTDFLLPNVLAMNGSIEYSTDVLADIGADTTAGTLRMLIHALIVPLPEIRIPPKVERKFFNGAGNALELGDASLIAQLTMLDAATHVAIAGGDFGAVTLNDRRGSVFAAVDAEILSRQAQVLGAAGHISPVQGEPRSATDDNTKIVNEDTPTALLAATASYNPIVPTCPGMRISKIEVESPLRLTWAGTQATSHILTTRILPRAEDEVKDLAVRAHKSLKIPFKGVKIKTLSKRPYVGLRGEYMPWDSSIR